MWSWCFCPVAGVCDPGIFGPGVFCPGIHCPGVFGPGVHDPAVFGPGLHGSGLCNFSGSWSFHTPSSAVPSSPVREEEEVLFGRRKNQQNQLEVLVQVQASRCSTCSCRSFRLVH